MAESEFKSVGGFKRVLKAASYSVRGLRFAFQHEAAFRQELALSLVLIPTAIWLAKSRWELLALIAPVLLVLIVEILNTAIEALADETSLERRERLGAAKDLGGAAVFIALGLTLLTWLLVLWPKT